VAVLDWNALQRSPHREDFDRHRGWLRRRQEALFHRLPTGRASGELIGQHALRVTWPLADGTVLALVANLDGAPLSLPRPSARPPALREVLAETETIAPTAPALPPWYVAWTVERRE
jgi:hypothetical protein